MTATDISPTAVRLFEAAAQRAGIASDRVRAFPCDAADPSAGESLLPGVHHCFSTTSQPYQVSMCMKQITDSSMLDLLISEDIDRVFEASLPER